MKIIEEIFNLIKDDLTTAFMGMAILVVLFLINTLLGIYRGTKNEGFKIKKLVEGIIKNLFCLMLPLFMFYAVLDIIPLWFERVGISGLQNIVSFFQAMLVIFVAIKNYITDIYEKYMEIFNVKKEDLPENQDFYG